MGKTLIPTSFENKSTLKRVCQMPILRPTSSEQPNQDKAFHQSVSSKPMAMSMMIDSMVNMMQNNRPALDDRIISGINRSNEY